ncbi:hypothetical protein AVEN_46348-1 [Araneus ventricosus]|uniref:Uncharacterized protein n=1 Tax=Araneus ventricosus TaxID=182803 RepID=A0A4Y2R6D8_ARAVE|nr:hypothetical protein AVEN_46348-1 [Araneus ventricosus]
MYVKSNPKNRDNIWMKFGMRSFCKECGSTLSVELNPSARRPSIRPSICAQVKGRRTEEGDEICFPYIFGPLLRSGGLVIKSRLRGRRVPGWKPDSIEDPPCMRPAAH